MSAFVVQIAIIITIVGVPAILGCAVYIVGLATKIYRGAENCAFVLGYEAGHHAALDEATVTDDTVQH